MSAVLALVGNDEETLKFYAESLKETFSKVHANVTNHVANHNIPVRVYLNNRNPSVFELDVVDRESLATAIFQISMADDFQLSANVDRRDAKSYHLTQVGHATALSDFEDMVGTYINKLTQYYSKKAADKAALYSLDY